MWYAGYQRQGIQEGTTGTINALYNGEIVGTCKVLFHNLGLNGNMSNITYKAEDGTELTSSKTTSMPFATPTSIRCKYTGIIIGEHIDFRMGVDH